MHLALAQGREAHLRLRRRAGPAAAAPLAAAEAALKRLSLAAGLALLGTALAYLLLGVALGVAAGWSQKTALDQAVGLAVHAGVVFARGVLPAVLATGTACLLWRRRRGSDPGVWGTLALSLVLAAVVTLLVLTSPIAGWPRLEVKGTRDAVATVVLLGAAGAGAELLARRWLRQRR